MGSEKDFGRVFAILARTYGFKPWDVERLTPEQLDMYLENAGYARFLEHLPQLQYAYSKLDEKAVEDVIRDGEARVRGEKPARTYEQERRALGWKYYALEQYGLLNDAAEGAGDALPLSDMSPEYARGLMEWWADERDPIPNEVWLTFLPSYERIVATAGTHPPP